MEKTSRKKTLHGWGEKEKWIISYFIGPQGTDKVICHYETNHKSCDKLPNFTMLIFISILKWWNCNVTQCPLGINKVVLILFLKFMGEECKLDSFNKAYLWAFYYSLRACRVVVRDMCIGLWHCVSSEICPILLDQTTAKGDFVCFMHFCFVCDVSVLFIYFSLFCSCWLVVITSCLSFAAVVFHVISLLQHILLKKKSINILFIKNRANTHLDMLPCASLKPGLVSTPPSRPHTRAIGENKGRPWCNSNTV